MVCMLFTALLTAIIVNPELTLPPEPGLAVFSWFS